MKKREVLTSIKDEKLIVERRNQMIKGAVTLFKEKGFHRTTTREIAKAAGFSIGTLYEYIQCVCELNIQTKKQRKRLQ